MVLAGIARAVAQHIPHRIKFKHWYPQFRPYLQSYVAESGACNDFFTNYITVPDCGSPECASDPLVSCLLDQFSSSAQANMQQSGVILGLMPTALALASSSTAEVGLLAVRRPLLALLIGAGGPAVNPIRAFDYRDPRDMMQKRDGAYTANFRPDAWWNPLVSVLEYVLAIGAIVNIAFNSWDLGLWTASPAFSNTSFLPLFWSFIAVLIHMGGLMSVYARVRLSHSDPRREGQFHPEMDKYSFVRQLHFAGHEFKLSSAHDHIYLWLAKENLFFIFISWLTSIGTVVHIIFGTYFFSATLFIESTDAVIVVARFLASTVACRIILSYELSGMRKSVTVIKNPGNREHEASDGVNMEGSGANAQEYIPLHSRNQSHNHVTTHNRQRLSNMAYG